jgi:hypothetical protein
MEAGRRDLLLRLLLETRQEGEAALLVLEERGGDPAGDS